ncbi:MAG TPA: tetratricopeptide repeat protein [Blastocatellia bacterium]|nr:tetratricopeptide repeat protein [Blastocatellia bacterium]
MRAASKVFQVCLLAFVVVCASVAAHAQEDMPTLPRSTPTSRTGSITGKVVLPSGQPVSERVRITLSSLNDPGMTNYTDSNGGFGFRGLREGMYTIEVAGDPKLYEVVTQEVRLIRGTHVRLHITLKEKAAPEGKKSTGNVVAATEFEQQIPDRAKKEFEAATKLVAQGKIEESIERYKRALAIFPNYLMARNDLGAQYLALKRPAEAAEQFEAAIEISPKAFNPRLNMGIALVDLRKFLAALEHINQALALDSSSPAAHLYFGIASVETDELEAAERGLNAALSIGGEPYSVAHYYLAHVHMKRGDRDAAIRELKTFLQKSPGNELAAQAKKLLETLQSGG